MLERFEAAVNLESWPQKAVSPPLLPGKCPMGEVDGKTRSQVQTGLFILEMEKVLSAFQQGAGRDCLVASFYRSELVANVSRSFRTDCFSALDESSLPPHFYNPDRYHQDEGIGYRLSDPIDFGIREASFIFQDMAALFPPSIDQEEARLVVLSANKIINAVMKLTENASGQVELLLNLRERVTTAQSPYEISSKGIDVTPEVADQLRACVDYEDASNFGRHFCPAYYTDFVSRYIKLLAKMSVELSVKTSARG